MSASDIVSFVLLRNSAGGIRRRRVTVTSRVDENDGTVNVKCDGC
jgi:hypothetical protein